LGEGIGIVAAVFNRIALFMIGMAVENRRHDQPCPDFHANVFRLTQPDSLPD